MKDDTRSAPPLARSATTTALVVSAVALATATTGAFVLCHFRSAAAFDEMAAAVVDCGPCCAGWMPAGVPREAAILLPAGHPSVAVPSASRRGLTRAMPEAGPR